MQTSVQKHAQEMQREKIKDSDESGGEDVDYDPKKFGEPVEGEQIPFREKGRLEYDHRGTAYVDPEKGAPRPVDCPDAPMTAEQLRLTDGG